MGGHVDYRYGWTEVEESSITGPNMIRDTYEKVGLIRQRLLTAKSRQKSYADVRRRPLKFEVGDHVFLKVMPKRGVVRFGKRGKLSPRYIGPFCHAPIPGPTRSTDPNLVRARDYILGLIYLFFLRAELVSVVIQTISVITKIIFIYKRTTTRVVSIKIYTHILSLIYLYMYHFFSNTKHQRSRKQCGEHLSLSRPALLMWDALSSILVFCFCTYMD